MEETRGMSTSSSPRPPSYGYGPQPPPYGQAPPQPYYPPQPPPGYGQPAQYAYPVAYPPPPAYYYPVYPQPDRTQSTIAGVMFLLCFLRDILYLVALLAVGSIFAGGMFGMLGAVVVVFAIFPVIGIIGSGIAMTSDFQHANYNTGTIGGVLALIGSSFPGILFIGPIGLVLSIIGLVLHTSARREFSS